MTRSVRLEETPAVAVRDGRRPRRWAAIAALVLTGPVLSGCAEGDPQAEAPAEASPEPAGTPVEDPAAAATRGLFADLADDEPGCSVAVAVDGDVAFAEAYGAAALDPVEPLEPDALVDIASTSKQFTAIAVGQLVLDGDVALDDAVGTHVDGLPAWGDEVTITDLIVHTSGIEDYIALLSDAGVELTDPADQADALAAVAATDLVAEPGEVFAYSNSNYLLLAEVVAAVTGDDLAAHLDERVFGPLGLDAQMAPGVELAGAAISYELDGEDDWMDADSVWTQQGDGGVWTTPTELVRFAETYWSDKGEWAEMAELRAQVGRETSTGTYRLGIEVFDADGEELLGHDGAWSGFETGFLVAPEREAAVAVTCTSPDLDVDTDGIEQQILDLWTA